MARGRAGGGHRVRSGNAIMAQRRNRFGRDKDLLAAAAFGTLGTARLRAGRLLGGHGYVRIVAQRRNRLAHLDGISTDRALRRFRPAGLRAGGRLGRFGHGLGMGGTVRLLREHQYIPAHGATGTGGVALFSTGGFHREDLLRRMAGGRDHRCGALHFAALQTGHIIGIAGLRAGGILRGEILPLVFGMRRNGDLCRRLRVAGTRDHSIIAPLNEICLHKLRIRIIPAQMSFSVFPMCFRHAEDQAVFFFRFFNDFQRNGIGVQNERHFCFCGKTVEKYRGPIEKSRLIHHIRMDQRSLMG